MKYGPENEISPLTHRQYTMYLTCVIRVVVIGVFLQDLSPLVNL